MPHLQAAPAGPLANPAVPRTPDEIALEAETWIGLEQLHHGVGPATWAVLGRAAARGHGVRIGLEDVDTLPDGAVATSTAALVAAARALLTEARCR